MFKTDAATAERRASGMTLVANRRQLPGVPPGKPARDEPEDAERTVN